MGWTFGGLVDFLTDFFGNEIDELWPKLIGIRECRKTAFEVPVPKR